MNNNILPEECQVLTFLSEDHNYSYAGYLPIVLQFNLTVFFYCLHPFLSFEQLIFV